MAHEIDMSNDQENIAFVGKLPWHGLGKELTEDATIEVWKEQSGLNFVVLPAPVLFKPNGCEETLVMPDRKLLYRSDTKAPLSVVSSGFKVVQPGDTLEFYRSLIENSDFKMETAGSLFGGRKFWALARCGESLRLMGQDEIRPYLLLASACDGSMSTVAHFTSVRVVCNNTLRMAVGVNGQKAAVRVPHSAQFDPEQAKAELGIIGDLWKIFGETAYKLASTKIEHDDAVDLVAKQMKTDWKEGMTHNEMLASSSSLRSIIRLFDGEAKGAEYKSSKGTAWGLLNAVTEHFDHEVSRSTGDNSRAFERAHLTDRAAFKVDFGNELLKLAA